MLGRLLFRLLLLLYPPWFRDRFGVEMLAEFDASRARQSDPASDRDVLVPHHLGLFQDDSSGLVALAYSPARNSEITNREGTTSV